MYTYRMLLISIPQGDDVPSLHVVVRELPKMALVEKQVIYHTGRLPQVDDIDDSIAAEPSYNQSQAGIIIHPVSALLMPKT
jgi:hypothetical protein